MSIFASIFGKQTDTLNKNSGAAPKKVLVVEDDKDLRDFYCELLTSEGFEVSIAKDGQSGLETVISQKPNLVLLDLMMPIMDGKTMLRKMRDIPEFKQTPVIILTNAPDADFIRQAQYFQANDVLIKANITPDVIITRINNFI